MATRQPTTDFESQLASIGVELEGPNEYQMVSRRHGVFPHTDTELWEMLRDALDLESRLRVNPPEPWRAEKQKPTERSWSARGHIIRLKTPGVLDDWTLTVDGTAVLEDASRMEAFQEAADRMQEISEHARVEV